MSVTVIPAQPKWFVVAMYSGIEEVPEDIMKAVWLMPIVGWVVEVEKEKDEDSRVVLTTPVCAESLPSEYAVMSPDYEVTVPDTCSYPNLREFVAAQLEEKKKKREKGK